MAVVLALLSGDPVGRQRIRIVEPCTIECIAAACGHQHPRRGFKVGSAVLQVALERREAVERLTKRHVRSVVKSREAEERAIVLGMADFGLPQYSVMELSRGDVFSRPWRQGCGRLGLR